MWWPYVHYLFLCVLLLAFAETEGWRNCKDHFMGDYCKRGMTVITAFRENPCSLKKNPFQKLVGKNPVSSADFSTVAELKRYFTRYCSEAMPAIRVCMDCAMMRCSWTQRMYVRDLSSKTSEICAPSSTQISSWLTYVLARLSDGDVADDSCSDEPDQSPCKTKASIASGFSSVTPSTPLEDQLLKVQTYSTTFIQCCIKQYRDSPTRCSNWREQALLAALSFGKPPVLGDNLKLSEAQLRELFEFTTR